jgi:hypothetical protein
MLRRAAGRGRQSILRELTRHRIVMQGDQTWKDRVKQLELMIDRIAGLRQGAFGSLLQQNFVRALLLLGTSASGISVLEHLILGP